MKFEDLYSYSSLIYYNNSIYYITEVAGNLMRIDLSSNEINVVGSYGSDTDEWFPYRKIVLCNDSLYLIPYNKSDIVIVNIKNGNVKSIDIPVDILKTIGEKPQYIGGFSDKDLIYMYGYNHIITCYDTKSDSFKMYDVADISSDFASWFRNSWCKVNDAIYIPFYEYPCLAKIENNTLQVVEIGVNNNIYSAYSMVFNYKNSVCYVQQNEKGNINVSLYKEGLFEQPYKSIAFDIYDGKDRRKGEVPFLTGYVDGESLVLLPGHGDNFGVFNVETEEVSYVKMNDCGCNSNDVKRWNYFDIAFGLNENYSLQYRTNSLCCLIGSKIENRSLVLSETDTKKYVQSSKIMLEEKSFGLKELLSTLQ